MSRIDLRTRKSIAWPDKPRPSPKSIWRQVSSQQASIKLRSSQSKVVTRWPAYTSAETRRILRVERRRSSESRRAEPKPCLADAVGEPVGVYVKDEEDRAVVEVPWDEVMRLPWADGDNGLVGRSAGRA